MTRKFGLVMCGVALVCVIGVFGIELSKKEKENE